MPDAVLALNAGSSSLKAALFAIGQDGRLDRRLTGQIESMSEAPHMVLHDSRDAIVAEQRWDGGGPGHEALLEAMLAAVEAYLGADAIVAAGHRVVHGGPDRAGPARIDAALLDELEGLVPLAPLHQPDNIAPMRVLGRLRPELIQVACFDTAFHRSMPDVATRYALPRELSAQGVRRYGFHGLSYAFVASRLAAIAPERARGRVIVAHLGNGASLCALRDGTSVDTTMGFSALDGLVMGTRCGAIDPGVLLYLQQRLGYGAKRIETLLYKESGLLGVSGFASDMRRLAGSEDPRAREAIELFVYRLAREAGGLVASLGGLDGLVFTGGIGEHDAAVRAAACARLQWLGIALDPEANAAHAARISTAESRVEVRVIPTDEEATIARETLGVVRAE